jgi:hypothetical protein
MVAPAAGAAVALYALYAAWISLLGVALKKDCITLPRASKRLPVLVYGRRRIPIAATKEVTAFGAFMGAEVVTLGSIEGEEPALFSSREQRLAFFEALKTRNPEVKIYRAF